MKLDLTKLGNSFALKKFTTGFSQRDAQFLHLECASLLANSEADFDATATSWLAKFQQKDSVEPRSVQKIEKILLDFSQRSSNEKTQKLLGLIKAKLSQEMPQLFAVANSRTSDNKQAALANYADSTRALMQADSKLLNELIGGRPPSDSKLAQLKNKPQPDEESKEAEEVIFPPIKPQICQSTQEKNELNLFCLRAYGEHLNRHNLLVKEEAAEQPQNSNEVKFDYYIKRNLGENLYLCSETIAASDLAAAPKWFGPLDKSSLSPKNTLAKIITLIALTQLNGSEYELIPFGRLYNCGLENPKTPLIRKYPGLSRLHSLLVRHTPTNSVFAYILGNCGQLKIQFNRKVTKFSQDNQATSEFKSLIYNLSHHSVSDKPELANIAGKLLAPISLEDQVTQVSDNLYELSIANTMDTLLLIPLNNLADDVQVVGLAVDDIKLPDPQTNAAVIGYLNQGLKQSLDLLLARSSLKVE